METLPTPCLSNSLQLIEVKLEALTVPDRELRKHSAAQIAKIARSIEKFGWVSPILVSSKFEVIAGAARIKAALKLGFDQAPALQVDHLSADQIRLYRLADNRLAEEADWNRENLRVEIAELLDAELEIDLTGFEAGEVDVLLDFDTRADADHDEAGGDIEPNTQPGDVWRIGEHLLICADALKDETWRIFSHQSIDAAFVDSPYNVPIDKNVCGLGKVQHREFIQASGEMSREEFSDFLTASHERLFASVKPGGVVFSCMDWRSIATLSDAGRGVGFELINMVVWDKMTGGMGSLYRSQHELICVFKKPGAPHRNNIQLGKYGRNRTNVWAYRGMNSAGGERTELLALHPTVKPTDLVIDAIKDVTARGETVLDCFGGSGTTMLAAHKAGRKSILIELDPLYVDAIIERMETQTGLRAEKLSASTGLGLSDFDGGRS